MTTSSHASPLPPVRQDVKTLCAVFAGQGSANANCLQELRVLYHSHHAQIAELLSDGAGIIAKLARHHDTVFSHEGAAFDVIDWLENPARAPEKAQLATALYSFPLIALTSLARYVIVCKSYASTPGELLDRLSGITGHSQGLIVAVCIAAARSWEDFYAAAQSAIELAFWIGHESHLASPGISSTQREIEDAVANDEGHPSTMLSIAGLSQTKVQELAERINKQTARDRHIHVALVNGREKVVVTGHVTTLRRLSLHLRSIAVPQDRDQSQILFMLRKGSLQQQWLPISAPFHSPYLEAVVSQVLCRLEDDSWGDKMLQLPVWHTEDGRDIQVEEPDRLAHIVTAAVMSQTLDWPKVCSNMNVDYILDFGCGSLVSDLFEGTGTGVLRLSKDIEAGLRALNDLTVSDRRQSWADMFRPRLTRLGDGKFSIVTKMTQRLNSPPLMIAGMTPTTTHWDFVAAIARAGYHAELALGGFSNPTELDRALRNLHAALPAGKGISCNVIYANPRQIKWQIPLLQRLREEGLVLEGLTIGAGIPSSEICANYINSLALKHLALKPATYLAMLEVVKVASDHPRTTFILQWTGGRAGGHHSYDDFHGPLLRAYAAIRRCSNIVLVVGSGFGDASGTWPYLTGDWSTAYDYPAMPVDGIMLGSRVMVAKEAHTAPAVKQLIADTPGLSDQDWHKTYEGPAGGIMTIKSEMGQPIHVLATRGAILWHHLQTKIFDILDPQKRQQKLQENRTEIIHRLNSDFAKPWFAKTRDGRCIDLQDMTYADVIARLCDLMYNHVLKQWISSDYMETIRKALNLVQERFPQEGSDAHGFDEQPAEILAYLCKFHPLAANQLLHPEDAMHLMNMFRQRGQKPVPFIPALDESFEFWFKKDSLWQSENLEAVLDQDVQRICIIHGPVAASHSRVVDEPISDILDAIVEGYIRELSDRAALEPLPISRLSRHLPKTLSSFQVSGDVNITQHDRKFTFRFDARGDLPELEAFVITLLQDDRGWAQACLTDEHVWRESQLSKILPNPVRNAFRPIGGDIVTIVYTEAWEIGSILLERPCAGDHALIEESMSISTVDFPCANTSQVSANELDSKRVTVTKKVRNPLTSKYAHVIFEFIYNPNQTRCHLTEADVGRNDRIKALYAELWNVELTPAIKSLGLTAEFPGEDLCIDRRTVEDFMQTVSKSDVVPASKWSQADHVPIDVCVLIAWKALVTPLLTPILDIDLLRLLHRSNSFKYYPGVEPLRVGDQLRSLSRVQAVTIQPSGKLIEVVADIWRSGQRVVEVTSVFLIQGRFSDFDKTFQSWREPEMHVHVSSESMAALLRSRSWLILDVEDADLIDKTIAFRTTLRQAFDRDAVVNDTFVNGEILLHTARKIWQPIGRVYFEDKQCIGNPVMRFLQRHGKPKRQRRDFATAGPEYDTAASLRVPRYSAPYSRSSKDTNPIHVCDLFASYCQLPGVVTHGMYTSAAVRRIIERAMIDADCSKFRTWSASFEGMVLPGDVLTVTWTHVAMIDGAMLLEVEARKESTKEKVLVARAEVEQPSTSYIFAGQGSQEKDMGMALYRSSAAARAVWDCGDRHLQESYGFSILQIVRENPPNLTIHFGGKKGRIIRERFLSLESSPDEDASQQCVLPGLTHASASHTFMEEKGLLFSTQFSQPALALMEIAEFEHLKEQAIIQNRACFAGHSLGEYSALGACTNLFSLENLLDLIFYRGLRMQNTVRRDAFGRTNYAMVAVDPSRVNPGFTSSQLRATVDMIQCASNLLLEIVNYNVTEQQYVCTGDLRALWMLGNVLDRSASHPYTAIDELVKASVATAPKLASSVTLERGRATIPLQGIDIPFHSTVLRGEIVNYRRYLRSKLVKEAVVPGELVGRWIPNVMGKPFELTESYVREVANATNSQELRQLLKCM